MTDSTHCKATCFVQGETKRCEREPNHGGEHTVQRRNTTPFRWHSPEKMSECSTCNDTGEVDETLGGIARSNPNAPCPDCRPVKKQHATFETDEEFLYQLADAKLMGKTGAVCNRCGKPLSDPASIEAGFGPECFEKVREEGEANEE